MILVFNELSSCGAALSLYDARARMTDMLRAVARFAEGRAVSLVGVGSVGEALVAEGYDIDGWLADGLADRDMKEFLRRIVGKIGLESEELESVRDRFYLSEFHAAADAAPGLGLAYLLETVGVSIPAEVRWREVEVGLRHEWVASDASVQERRVRVLNLATGANVGRVKEQYRTRRQEALQEGRGGWVEEMAEECFPHLRFGPEIYGRLERLAGGERSQVIRTLIALDGIARDWRRSGSDPRRSGMIRGESQPTMQKYGERRVFRTAEGGTASFELHASAGERQRVHLRLDYDEKSMEIGYIGGHLPTKKYPA